jgi:hypothetical protein
MYHRETCEESEAIFCAVVYVVSGQPLRSCFALLILAYPEQATEEDPLRAFRCGSVWPRHLFSTIPVNFGRPHFQGSLESTTSNCD